MDIDIIQYSEQYFDIICKAGHLCYGVTKNPCSDFIKKLIKNSHESVLEHAFITLKFKNATRSFMAQITRHRLASFSIKSQHFVDHSDFAYKPIDTANKNIQSIYDNSIKAIRISYNMLRKEGVPHYIARDILPNCAYTDIFMTANIREWRHIFKLRCSTNNTPEMHLNMIKALKLVYNIMPECFEDLINEYVKLH